MPKRGLDTTGGMDKFQKKTERSHEENQERAYIAASRRADRSIEARVQSARMASSIHKKRTGRGFKVTEEIVMKEEMYEEEEDEFPRHYRALTAHLQTGSTEMNNRLSAYVSNHVALASLAHQQQVDRMFAEQFPNAAQISRRLSSTMQFQPINTVQANNAAAFSPVDYTPTAQPCHRRHKSRSHSASSTSTARPSTRPKLSHGSPSPRQPTLDETLSPPAMSPGSGGSSETPSSTISPMFSAPSCYPASTGVISDPLLTMNNDPSSVFTTELPAETKLLANLNPHDPMNSMFFGDSGEMMGSDGFYNFMGQGSTSYPMPESMPIKAESQEYFSANKGYGNFPDGSRIGTPSGGHGGDTWESWVQYD